MKIPLFKIYWDEDDLEAVKKTLSGGISWAIGPEIEAFERKLAQYLNIKHCVTFNSGTSALHAVLLAYGIGVGDEVIVPSFTFIATSNAVLFIGAKPVFADIEEKTLSLDPEDVERKITPRTKAIIPIHYAGCPCQIKDLRDLAVKYNLLLIEDACEALGADVKGKKVGTLGQASVLSFCQNKIITTGEGGAVVTDNPFIYQKLKLIRSHGQEDRDYFSSNNLDYVTLGYNFRMSSINAALGLSQLAKIEHLIEMRWDNAQLYGLPSLPSEGNVYQMFSIRVRDRDGLMKHLVSKGIASKVNFYPVHQTYFYKSLRYKDSLPITEAVSREILSLPMYPGLTKEEIVYISENVREYYEEANNKARAVHS